MPELTKGILKPCCVKRQNLEPPVWVDDETIYRRCKTCGCRHFEQVVEPGVLRTEGR